MSPAAILDLSRAYYEGDDGGKLPPMPPISARGDFLHLGGIQNLPVWQTLRDFLGTIT